MQSYAGISLPDVTVDMAARISRRISPEWVWDFEPAGWSGPQRVGWIRPPAAPREPIRIGKLIWPISASRWSHGYYLVTSQILTAIRQKVFAGQVYQSAPFVLDSGDGNTVKAPMWMLPARPLFQIARSLGAGDISEDLYLLCLVDERYFWWYEAATIAAASSWSGLITSIATAMGVTLSSIDPIPAGYGTPPSSLTAQYEMLPVLMDAICYAVGMKLVVDFDGTASVQSYATAKSTVTTEYGKWSKFVHAGGQYDFAQNQTDPNALDLNALAPESVTAVFPPEQDPTASTPSVPFAVNTSLSSLSLNDYGHATGFQTAKVSWLPVLATYANGGAAPTNATALQAYGKQWASDFYLWQLGRYDLRLSGNVPWTPSGLTDRIEFTNTELGIKTRVRRGQWVDYNPLVPGGGIGQLPTPTPRQDCVTCPACATPMSYAMTVSVPGINLDVVVRWSTTNIGQCSDISSIVGNNQCTSKVWTLTYTGGGGTFATDTPSPLTLTYKGAGVWQDQNQNVLFGIGEISGFFFGFLEILQGPCATLVYYPPGVAQGTPTWNWCQANTLTLSTLNPPAGCTGAPPQITLTPDTPSCCTSTDCSADCIWISDDKNTTLRHNNSGWILHVNGQDYPIAHWKCCGSNEAILPALGMATITPVYQCCPVPVVDKPPCLTCAGCPNCGGEVSRYWLVCTQFTHGNQFSDVLQAVAPSDELGVGCLWRSENQLYELRYLTNTQSWHFVVLDSSGTVIADITPSPGVGWSCCGPNAIAINTGGYNGIVYLIPVNQCCNTFTPSGIPPGPPGSQGSATFYEHEPRCEAGILNVYTRTVTITIINGILQPAMFGPWKFDYQAGCCNCPAITVSSASGSASASASSSAGQTCIVCANCPQVTSFAWVITFIGTDVEDQVTVYYQGNCVWQSGDGTVTLTVNNDGTTTVTFNSNPGGPAASGCVTLDLGNGPISVSQQWEAIASAGRFTGGFSCAQYNDSVLTQSGNVALWVDLTDVEFLSINWVQAAGTYFANLSFAGGQPNFQGITYISENFDPCVGGTVQLSQVIGPGNCTAIPQSIDVVPKAACCGPPVLTYTFNNWDCCNPNIMTTAVEIVIAEPVYTCCTASSSSSSSASAAAPCICVTCPAWGQSMSCLWNYTINPTSIGGVPTTGTVTYSPVTQSLGGSPACVWRDTVNNVLFIYFNGVWYLTSAQVNVGIFAFNNFNSCGTNVSTRADATATVSPVYNCCAVSSSSSSSSASTTALDCNGCVDIPGLGPVAKEWVATTTFDSAGSANCCSAYDVATLCWNGSFWQSADGVVVMKLVYSIGGAVVGPQVTYNGSPCAINNLVYTQTWGTAQWCNGGIATWQSGTPGICPVTPTTINLAPQAVPNCCPPPSGSSSSSSASSNLIYPPCCPTGIPTTIHLTVNQALNCANAVNSVLSLVQNGPSFWRWTGAAANGFTWFLNCTGGGLWTLGIANALGQTCCSIGNVPQQCLPMTLNLTQGGGCAGCNCNISVTLTS